MRLMPILLSALLLGNIAAAAAEPSPGKDTSRSMSVERLAELIRRIDPDAVQRDYTWEFALESYTVAMIADPAADRMRLVIPIRSTTDLGTEELLRLMQANFDSALDARYAIARGVLWATYIHPLSPLTDEQFLTAVGQTANIVSTYGTTYSSGLFLFEGGDSGAIQRRELIERLRELGTDT